MEYKIFYPKYEGVYQNKDEYYKASRPFSLNQEIKPDTCVLLIHGYQGYPGELVRPAEDLYKKGYDVFVPLLPGMGTTREDFLNSTEKDWINYSKNVYEDLKKEYKEVLVMGHSMGCLLVILLEAPKYALVAPGIKVKGLNKALVGLLSLFKKDIPREWKGDSRFNLHYEDAPKDDERLGKEYWSHLYTKQLYYMARLRDKAVKVLKNTNADILTIECGKDSLIEPGVSEFIKNNGRGKRDSLLIENATHYVFYDIDSHSEERAVQAVLDFFSNSNI